jgi:hypothetical protein
MIVNGHDKMALPSNNPANLEVGIICQLKPFRKGHGFLLGRKTSLDELHRFSPTWSGNESTLEGEI